MSINWVEFFGLKGNPFSTAPLEDEFELTNLLVRTKSIRDQVLPIAKFIGISAPSIKILLGSRGSGKSTCLSLLRQLVQGNGNVLTISINEIRLPERTIEDATLSIGSPLLWFLIKDIIESLKVRYEEVYEKNLSVISNIKKSLGLKELFPRTYPVWSSCNIALDSLLNILEKNNITLFIGIDNYDKLPEKFQTIALDFLRGSNAQPFFEKLQRIGSTILISLGKEFYSQLRHPDFSYLGKPIEIRGLNPTETKELLEKRLEWVIESSEVDGAEIFSDSAIHRMTMHKNGIAREILILAEQSMINASKRKIKRVDEKIVKDTIQLTEEVTEEYYEMIKSITPVSMARAAEEGFKILNNFFSSLPSTEFALNVIDCLLDIFNNPKANYDPTSDYFKALVDSKIVTFVESFPENEWRIRIDVLNLMGHMNSKKSLRKFLDWLIEKEVQVKPPAYHLVNIIKKGTDTAYKFESIIKGLKEKKIKECINKANKRIRELEAYSLEDELDSNTQVIGIVEVTFELGKALYYLDMIIRGDKIPKRDPDKDRILRFLKLNYPNLWFDMEFIFKIDELRHLDIQSKERIRDASIKYASFLQMSYQKITQQIRSLERKEDEPKSIVIKNILGLEPYLEQLFSEKNRLLIIEEKNNLSRMAIVLWMTLAEKKDEIYGFACGDLSKDETKHLESREFTRRKLILFPEIEVNLNSYKETILQHYYKKMIPVVLYGISDVMRFFRDLLDCSILSKGIMINVIKEGRVIDSLSLEKDSNKYRLCYYPMRKEEITQLEEERNVEMVVLDGNNLARFGKTKTGKASFNNIIMAIFKLKQMGIEVVPFVTKSLFKDIDDRRSLENSIKSKLLQTPPSEHQDDDYYFLSYALEKNGYILSLDNFRDWKKANPEKASLITQRQIKYYFVKGEIFFEGVLGSLRSPS